MEPTATASLGVDRVWAWPDEMRRAVGRRDSLPTAARSAFPVRARDAGLLKLRGKDSNLDYLIQSQASYR